MAEQFNRIQEVLEEKELSQAWLARELNVSNNAINHLCKNYSQPSLKRLYEIAEIIGVDASELIISKKVGGVVDTQELPNGLPDDVDLQRLIEVYIFNAKKRKAINELLK